MKITVLIFLVKKMYNEAIRGVYYLRIREKLIERNLVLVVVLVLESKDLSSQQSISTINV